ncbi:MAG TPA: hypothetical protein VMR19_01155 [Candidatus Saccharimonadales bacterium]|jgi:hypothetical protein|nr:hypothetical protein [Candidatus Saccharimonadales bacterium]
MPDGMSSPENVSWVNGMPVTPARPDSAQILRGITSVGGPSYEAAHNVKMLNSDPFYERQLDNALNGLLGHERAGFERDKLGLYQPAGNFAESLIDLNNLPSKGDPEFLKQQGQFILVKQHQFEEAAKKEQSESGKKGPIIITDAARVQWQQDASDELEHNEKVKSVELSRNFKLAVAAGNRSLNETLLMIEAFVAPKPFEANRQEATFLTGRQTMEATAVYFDGKLSDKVAGWYRAFDATNEQQFALFNIIAAGGGTLEGYFDALLQAGETIRSRSRFHATVDHFRAAFTNDDPGVSTNVLKDGEKEKIKDTLASKEIREMQVEMLSQARRLTMFNTDVAQFDVDKPVGQEGFMKLDPIKIQGKIDALKIKMAELRARKKDAKADMIQKHIDSLERTRDLNLENHREFMRQVFGVREKKDGTFRWIKISRNDKGDVDRDDDGNIKCTELVRGEDGKFYIIEEKNDDDEIVRKSEITKGDRDVFTPKEILTWYASGDQVGVREEWLAKMIAVLKWKDKDGKGISDFLENTPQAEILRVAREIIETAENIQDNIGDKLMNTNFEFAAAKIGLVSWIEQDKAFQVSGALASMFKYREFKEKDKDGKVIKTWMGRVKDMGGIYKAYDSINLRDWLQRLVMYKSGMKSATPFIIASSDSWRREMSKHGPEWAPPLEQTFKNKKIQRLHKRFFEDGDTTANDNSNFVLWRARRLRGDGHLTLDGMNELIKAGKLKEPKIDKKLKEKLLEAGWTFETAYGVPIPMYLPKFFQTTLWETMVDKSTKETVWDLYQMGIMPKDIDWSVYNYESLDRMWVSMSMLNRFAKFFVDTYEEQRDPDFMKFFGEASPQSIAEMAKRVYLAFRDLPKDPDSTMDKYQQHIVQIVPFMIAQYTAKAVGLTSPDIGTSGSKEKVLKQWNFSMSKWIRAANYGPEVILDDEQLYNGANAELHSMKNDLALMIMYYKHVFEKVGQATYKVDVGKLFNIYGDQLHLHEDALKEELSGEHGEPDFSMPATQKVSVNPSDGEGAVAALLFGERH